MYVIIGDSMDAHLQKPFEFIFSLSDYLECYFHDLRYGEGVEKLSWGILCKSVLTELPLERILIPERNKYYKKRKEVHYDIVLNYETAVNKKSQTELQAMVVTAILDSLEPRFGNFKVQNFDLPAFKAELQIAFDLVSPDVIAKLGNLSNMFMEQGKRICNKFIRKHAAPGRFPTPTSNGDSAEKAAKEKQLDKKTVVTA